VSQNKPLVHSILQMGPKKDYVGVTKALNLKLYRTHIQSHSPSDRNKHSNRLFSFWKLFL